MAGRSETAPLLFARQRSNVHESLALREEWDDGGVEYANAAFDGDETYGFDAKGRWRAAGAQLGTITGCYIPVLQTIVGIIVFLRLPWAVGQVGLAAVLVWIVIGQVLSMLTVLSLSALVTNGKVQAGGIYFIVSRTLGPAFGGGLGVLYWGGYTVSVAFYSLGMGSLAQSTFFPSCGTPAEESSLSGTCSPFNERTTAQIIGSCMLFLMLLISLCGASQKRNADLVFTVILAVSILYAVISCLIPHDYKYYNTITEEAINATTSYPGHFNENMLPDFQTDPSCSDGECSYGAVAAILFPMFIGIMQGANLSVDMRDPGRSIPVGSLCAILTAGAVYVLVATSAAGAIEHAALQLDQNVLQNLAMHSIYPVFAGIAFSAASSTMGNLYGASKVLDAMAQDEIFGALLRPFKSRGNGAAPRAAVALTWLIAQSCVAAGDIDAVAPILTSIFLLAWAVMNLTCAILTWLGTPNFRPSWRFYSVRTAVAGFVLTMGVNLYLDWVNTLVGMLLLSLLTTYLLIMAPAKDWGSVSRELMTYQIRKFAVQLSGEKQHAKYWRPNILAIAEAPTPGLLAFCNELKSGGLLVVGHVVPGEPRVAHAVVEPLLRGWQHYFRATKMQGLPQVVAHPSTFSGYQLMAGMGSLGMNFNTVVLPLAAAGGGRLGLRDDVGAGGLSSGAGAGSGSRSTGLGYFRKAARELAETPLLRIRTGPGSLKLPSVSSLTHSEWCGLVHGLVEMRKNVIVAANFGSGTETRGGLLRPDRSDAKFIDVWLPPDTMLTDVAMSTRVLESKRETLSYLMVQLAETLRMAMGRRQKLRLFQVVHCYSPNAVEQANAVDNATARIGEFARSCRVQPDSIAVFTMADVRNRSKRYARESSASAASGGKPLAKLRKLPRVTVAQVDNELIASTAADARQILLPLLDLGPGGEASQSSAAEYVEHLRTHADGLPPVVFVATGATDSIISDGL